MIAFYPIKPIYSEKILSGEKTYELRKKLPNCNIEYILIYSTLPIGKVVGYAKVKAFHKKTVDELWWKIASKFGGIERHDYFNYFSEDKFAYAIELNEVKKFLEPFGVKEINQNFKVPQSFCYVDTNDFNRLKKRKTENV